MSKLCILWDGPHVLFRHIWPRNCRPLTWTKLGKFCVSTVKGCWPIHSIRVAGAAYGGACWQECQLEGGPRQHFTFWCIQTHSMCECVSCIVVSFMQERMPAEFLYTCICLTVQRDKSFWYPGTCIWLPQCQGHCFTLILKWSDLPCVSSQEAKLELIRKKIATVLLICY